MVDLDELRRQGEAARRRKMEKPAVVAGWQPIETAPKNHILLVGFFNSLGKWRSMHAQWRDDLPQHDMAEEDEEPAEAGWYEGSLEAEMLFPCRPTHWQYLPEPPPIK